MPLPRATASDTPPEVAARPPLTVIVPVMDEEPVLPDLHRRLRAAVPEDSEIIYIDDGSTDASAAVLGRIAAADPLARAFRLRRHLGKSEALLVGFARARGSRIATIDADLQEDPREIPRLLKVLDVDGYDLVGGWRRRRRDPAGKIVVSRVFNVLVTLLSGKKFLDINCGLKVLRREVVDEISLASGFHRFIPLLAHWKGFRVAEREVEHQPRAHGRSHYGGERIFHGLVDLLVVLFLARSSQRPSRYFIGMGMFLSLAGSGISAYLAWLRLAHGTIHSRYPLLALGLLCILAGLQVITLGFFAELISYIFRAGRAPAPAVEELTR